MKVNRRLFNTFYFICIFSFLKGTAYCQNIDKHNLGKVIITNVETSGIDNSFKSIYILDYAQNIVKVFCKAPISPDSIRFFLFNIKSPLNLFDEDDLWIKEIKPEKKFNNLYSGIYIVSIKYVLKNGKVSKVNSFKVDIRRPWWRTWWFWTCSFILMFGFFYFRERYLKRKAEEKQKYLVQIAELELRTLQLQMNPHFVFNALNAIQSFILNQNAVSANNYLSKFAQIIRMFLNSSRSKYITLNEELELLNLYIELESLRFEGKFDYEIILDAQVNKYFEIPSMLLQPFVENALNHGFRYKKEKGYLKISFFSSGNFLICRIEDNGVGRIKAKKIQSESKKGYVSQGLKITTERLVTFNKINGSKIKFSVSDLIKNPSDEEDVGTLVEIVFPLI